jgi:hypothetical protein
VTADDPRPAGEVAVLPCPNSLADVDGWHPCALPRNHPGPCWAARPDLITRPAASGGATDGDEVARRRRELLGDTIVDDTESPVASAARSAFRLGWDAAREPVASQADGELRDALLTHHPIMRSETGPLSGCRCGQVKLGQDVIAHVVTELRRALDGDQ